MYMCYVATAAVKKSAGGPWDCVNVVGTLRLGAGPWRSLSVVRFSSARGCVQVQSTMEWSPLDPTPGSPGPYTKDLFSDQKFPSLLVPWSHLLVHLFGSTPSSLFVSSDQA